MTIDQALNNLSQSDRTRYAEILKLLEPSTFRNLLIGQQKDALNAANSMWWQCVNTPLESQLKGAIALAKASVEGLVQC